VPDNSDGLLSGADAMVSHLRTPSRRSCIDLFALGASFAHVGAEALHNLVGLQALGPPMPRCCPLAAVAGTSDELLVSFSGGTHGGCNPPPHRGS
jgi:hypothetical protein